MSTDPDTAERRSAAFEYRTLRVGTDEAALQRDTYRSFGWDVETSAARRTATLHLQRDRGLKHLGVVVELQAAAERALRAIRILERSRTRVPGAVAVTVGLVGAALLAVSVFAMQAEASGLSIGAGAAGVALWLLAFPLHLAVRVWRDRAITPRLAREHAVLHDTGEQASRLLA